MPDSVPPLTDTSELEAELRPAEPKRALSTIFLGGLFMLAVLTACYAAAEIALPIVLAFVLSLVFQPVLRILERAYLPRVIASLVIVLFLVGLFVVLVLLLSTPVAGLIGQLPQTLPRLQERIRFLNAPLLSLQHAFELFQQLAPGSAAPTVVMQGPSLAERLLAAIRPVAAGAFTTMLVLFFVLISGDLFLRRLVELLPGFKEKRQVVDISQQIQGDISAFLATITMMNLAVGIVTGIVMWLFGLGSPLLWGTIAFLLNFVPIIGPIAAIALFLVVGLVTIDPLWAAFLPAALYLVIHIIEGETVTPMLLAARFTINPVLVILGVIFWSWMWGVPGAILSTPMLAIVKIICDRIEGLRPVGHFIGA